mmetsp:Transcript_2702/g.4210  ORF Transcript_2702/g.4210 Transcript_2702/m.4210 type:complete len:207 (+) Transcript_2702:624-1244(+)
MAGQGVDTLATSNIPQLRCVIKAARENFVTVRGKIQGHNLSCVALQCPHQLSELHVPKLGTVVHRPCRNLSAEWIEGDNNDLGLVPPQSVDQSSADRIPDFCGFVERSCNDLVPEWVVESDRIDDVAVPFKCEELLAGQSVPDTTGSIIRPCYEFAARLVEATICERQDVSTQDLEKVEPLCTLGLKLVHQPVNELPQNRLLGLAD